MSKAIDDAVAKGVAVMTFDVDLPKSKRFAHFGADDTKAGEMGLQALSQLLGGSGTVAVLAGNPDAPNLQRRVAGVKAAALGHPGLEIVGVFHHLERPLRRRRRSPPGQQDPSRPQGMGHDWRLAHVRVCPPQGRPEGPPDARTEGGGDRRAARSAALRRRWGRGPAGASRSTNGGLSPSARSWTSSTTRKTSRAGSRGSSCASRARTWRRGPVSSATGASAGSTRSTFRPSRRSVVR